MLSGAVRAEDKATAFAGAVFAGSVGDKIKNFLLGTEARVGTAATHTVKLDRLSLHCMQCHNGSTPGKRVSIKAADTPMRFEGFRSLDHPVGMFYDEHASRNPHRFRPTFSLDRSVRLVDGKVSCISCHRLKQGVPADLASVSWNKNGERACTASEKLAIDSATRNLCLACHID
jgi:hypothetical protein